MHNHSYENEFNLHVNEISFSYERMSTKTRFEKEAKGNSEMAYYVLVTVINIVVWHIYNDDGPWTTAVKHVACCYQAGFRAMGMMIFC